MALTPEQHAQLRQNGFVVQGTDLYLDAGASGWDPTGGGGYQRYDISDMGDPAKWADDQALKGKTFELYNANGEMLGTQKNTWGGTSQIVKMAPYIMAALYTMGVGATISGVNAASAAGGAGAAGATGTMPYLAGPELGAYGAELGSTIPTFGAEAAGATAAASGAGGATGTMPALAGPELGAYGAELGSTIPSYTAAGGAAAAAGGAAGTAAAGGGGTLGTITSLAGPALSLVGAKTAADAAKEAAATQSAAADKSLDLYREMFYKNIELQEPWRKVGVQGINKMADLLGISGNAGTEGYGDLTRKFDMQKDYLEDPGYQFRLSEGSKALERSAAARGGLLSGRAAKDMTRFGQGEASQEFGNSWNRWNTQNTNTYNRLAGVSGAGQTAASNVGNAATNYANQAGNTIQGQGNANAAGQIGQANAWQQGIGNAWSMYQQNQMMNSLLNR